MFWIFPTFTLECWLGMRYQQKVKNYDFKGILIYNQQIAPQDLHLLYLCKRYLHYIS